MSVDISFFTEPPPAEPPPAEPEPTAKPRKVELTDLPGIPNVPKFIVWDKKREKEWDKSMRLAERELKRMNRPAPMTDQERKERRRVQQAERRAAKALSEVVL
jgi:hypothetical protein